jgi:hypothetical protein
MIFWKMSEISNLKFKKKLYVSKVATSAVCGMSNVRSGGHDFFFNNKKFATIIKTSVLT